MITFLNGINFIPSFHKCKNDKDIILAPGSIPFVPPGFAIAYLDDILIYSDTVVDHMRHLEAVLRIHAEVGMKINLSKTKIFRDQVTYLGHLVSHQGVEMIPDYISKIQLWPIPKTGKELISFLGFTS